MEEISKLTQAVITRVGRLTQDRSDTSLLVVRASVLQIHDIRVSSIRNNSRLDDLIVDDNQI